MIDFVKWIVKAYFVLMFALILLGLLAGLASVIAGAF